MSLWYNKISILKELQVKNVGVDAVQPDKPNNSVNWNLNKLLNFEPLAESEY